MIYLNILNEKLKIENQKHIILKIEYIKHQYIEK